MFWKSKEPKGWCIKETNEGKFYMVNYTDKELAYKAVALNEDGKYVITKWYEPCAFNTAEEAIAEFYDILQYYTLHRYKTSVKAGVTELHIPVIGYKH